jgi:hypothetical protein
MEIVKKIGGKDRGFKFTMKTLEYFSELKGCDFSGVWQILKDRSLLCASGILFAAHKCYMKGEIVKNKKTGELLTEFDMDDWIMSMQQGELQDIWDCFEESLPKIFEKITDKKKVAKT